MKLTHITAQNYLGARSVELAVTTPIMLIAGKNGAGKSSLQEAIRHALGGDFARVVHKKDFKALISDGANAGFATVATDAGECSIVLPSGKGVHHDHLALPLVLDVGRFARLSENERRQFLFSLFGMTTDGPAVTDALKARGCDQAKIEKIRQPLREGFAAAHKKAKDFSSEARGEWKSTTGEAYGEVKAPSWKASTPEETYTREQIKTAEALVAESEASIAEANQKLGELRAAAKNRANAEARVEELKAKAGRLAALREKLVRDQADLNEWTAKLANLPEPGSSKPAPHLYGCPCCGVALQIVGGELVKYELPEAGPLDPDIETKRKQWTDAVALYTRSVANDQRDIADAERAAQEIVALEKRLGEAPPATELLEQLLAGHQTDKKSRAATLAQMFEANRQAQAASENTTKAAAHHADVMAWLAISDALAPDGIPAEMLDDAIDSINASLRGHCPAAEWAKTLISSDMDILAAGRPYALLSESEKWRVDALIGAAIAEMSGLRLLVLDRFDVLDSKGREDLMFWLDGAVADGQIDTALIFGTLKALPAGLPETITPVWIEGGVVGEMREAA